MASYHPDSFSPASEELDRLRHRARLGRRHFVRRMKEQGLQKGMRVLDLGCGEGTFTVRLASYCHPHAAVGLDSSARLVAAARERTAGLQLPNLRFVHGHAEELPFEDGAFEFVHARLTFQHFSRPGVVLAEVLRTLVPGGRVVIDDVDHGMIVVHPEPADWGRVSRAWREGQCRAGGDPLVGRKLAALLRAGGFSEVRSVMEPRHGRGPAVTEFATELGPSLLDYVEDPELRRRGETMFRELARPEVAAATDIYLVSFVARGTNPVGAAD